MTRQEILAIAKPILFNTEMVRAILDNRKTAMRRVIKYQNTQDSNKTLDDFIGDADPQLLVGCCQYKVGDYIYVRETWGKVECRNCPTELCSCCPSLDANFNYGYIFRADDISLEHTMKWRPSIHMPKEAARIFLRVTDVRVERLQEITEDGKTSEGMNVGWQHYNFYELWDSTIPKKDLDRYGWDTNPWVWVIEFERVEANA